MNGSSSRDELCDHYDQANRGLLAYPKCSMRGNRTRCVGRRRPKQVMTQRCARERLRYLFNLGCSQGEWIVSNNSKLQAWIPDEGAFPAIETVGEVGQRKGR